MLGLQTEQEACGETVDVVHAVNVILGLAVRQVPVCPHHQQPHLVGMSFSTVPFVGGYSVLCKDVLYQSKKEPGEIEEATECEERPGPAEVHH